MATLAYTDMSAENTMTQTLYRASAVRPTGRDGECWTDDLSAAEAYMTCDGCKVWRAEVDLSGAVEVDGYDHDENYAPADDDAFRARIAATGVTWVHYDDETEQGTEMTCYRLVRDTDLTAEIEIDEDEDECW